MAVNQRLSSESYIFSSIVNGRNPQRCGKEEVPPVPEKADRTALGLYGGEKQIGCSFRKKVVLFQISAYPTP